MARESTFDRNLKARMNVTMDSELEPELVTPMSAGAEELVEYEEIFPLTKQFGQTNMRSPKRGTGRNGQRGLGRDAS